MRKLVGPPKATDPCALKRKEPAVDFAQLAKIRNVLIIDDMLEWAAMLRMAIEHTNRRAKITESSTETLDTVRAGDTQLVFMDLQINDKMDAYELMRRIKEIDPTISIVVISGYALEDIRGDLEKYRVWPGIVNRFFQKAERIEVARFLEETEGMRQRELETIQRKNI